MHTTPLLQTLQKAYNRVVVETTALEEPGLERPSINPRDRFPDLCLGVFFLPERKVATTHQHHNNHV